jgi:hypothetical protein
VSYRVEILSAGGKAVHSVALPENQLGNMASLNMPAEALEPGEYSIAVFGRKSDGTQEEVGRSKFELQPSVD